MDIRAIPPFDALPYFSLPTEVYFTSPNVGVQLAMPDPNRYLLLFSVQAGNTMVISTGDDGNDQHGIANSSSSNTILITYESHGPLVCAGWWNQNDLTAVVTVISLRLNGAPIPQNSSGLPSLPAIPPPPPQQITQATGVKGGMGLLDFWASLMSKLRGGGQ